MIEPFWMYKIKPFVIHPYKKSPSTRKGQKHTDILKMAEELLLHKDVNKSMESTLYNFNRYSKIQRSTQTLRPVREQNSLRKNQGNTSLGSIEKGKTPNEINSKSLSSRRDLSLNESYASIKSPTALGKMKTSAGKFSYSLEFQKQIYNSNGPALRSQKSNAGKSKD
jgi:hypothetical protein